MSTLTTPVYGWRYPDANENINVVQMQNLATDMDTSFNAYDLRNIAGSKMGGASVFTNGQVLPLNTDTVISFTGEDWDDSNFWNIGAPTIISLTPGIYWCYGVMDTSGSASALGLRLKLGATTLYDSINSNGLAAFTDAVQIFGDVYVTTNSSLTMTARWHGSGTGGAAGYTALSVMKVRSSLP